MLSKQELLERGTAFGMGGLCRLYIGADEIGKLKQLTFVSKTSTVCYMDMSSLTRVRLCHITSAQDDQLLHNSLA